MKIRKADETKSARQNGAVTQLPDKEYYAELAERKEFLRKETNKNRYNQHMKIPNYT